MAEELASDSQTVNWSLQIDARRRLDLLLIGSVDPGLRAALAATVAHDDIPPKAREDAQKALSGINDKLKEYKKEYRPDALFAVDREGRVVAQLGFGAATTFKDFELGGYPAVFDALHGFLRDDTWVLGGKIYRVSARPVEDAADQAPLGAIVGLKAVESEFVQELARRTRASIVFFAGRPENVAAAPYEHEPGRRSTRRSSNPR